MPVEKVCVICSKKFSVPPCRSNTATTCSNKCAVSVRAKSRERKVSCMCKNCGKEFTSPRSQAGRRIYCSSECKFSSIEFASIMSNATKMDNNPQWKGGIVSAGGGYLNRRCPDHPLSSNGYVLEHRFVMEQWLLEVDPKSNFLVEINGAMYLAPGFDVHHLDGNRVNNKRSNLLVCTKQTHVLIHAGYGVNSGTFWPNTAKIKVDETSPSQKTRARRKAKRQEHAKATKRTLSRRRKSTHSPALRGG